MAEEREARRGDKKEERRREKRKGCEGTLSIA
jgi:hypothetical protein